MTNRSSLIGFIVSSILHAMIVVGVIYTSIEESSVAMQEPKITKISLSNYTPAPKQEPVVPKPKKVTPKPTVKKKTPIEKPKIKEIVVEKEIIKEEEVVEEIVEEIIEEVAEIEEPMVEEPMVEEVAEADETSQEDIKQEVSEIETAAIDMQQTQSRAEEQSMSKTDFEIIRDMVLSNVKYPSMAKRMHITGVVEVVLVIDSSGKLLEVVLGESSGNKLLDKSAIKAAKKLSKLTLPNPTHLTRVTLPVAFALN